MGKQRNTIRNKRKIRISNYQNDVADMKDAKSRISKGFSRELKFTIISIFVVMIVMISSAFAIFSSIQKSNKYNTLTVGTLKVDFVDTEEGMGNAINLNGAFPVSDTEGLKEEPYSFKITNSGTVEASYKIKILDDADIINEDQCANNLLDKRRIRVSVNKGDALTLSTREMSNYEIASGTLAAGKSINYEIRIWIDENSGNEVLGRHYHGKIVVESMNTRYKNKNSNILSAYAYNATNCVTGEENTCIETTCYQDKSANSCGVGTIVKYGVNTNQDHYFYVLHDDGELMTLQQRENTVNNVDWYANRDNSQGPLTVLSSLENKTSNWTNVEDQTYTMGTTVFYDNAYTGCDNDQCIENKYTLGERVTKARMITLQEVFSLKCTTSNLSCPKWMHNYLSNSKEYQGTVNDIEAGSGYWTMSSNRNQGGAYAITSQGGFTNWFTDSPAGARAVVVIHK